MFGIGSSGPQVVEGWHGVPFDAPVPRMREIIDICRKVWRREVVNHQGKRYQIPLPADLGTGLGKPLKTITRPVRDSIPTNRPPTPPPATTHRSPRGGAQRRLEGFSTQPPIEQATDLPPRSSRAKSPPSTLVATTEGDP